MSKRERQRAARRRGRAEQRDRTRRAEATANLVYDPMTEPERAAEILAGLFGDAPVEAGVAARLVTTADVGRAREVADAALRRKPDPMALSLAADVALLDGRPADAEAHVVRALELTDRPDLHLRLAAVRIDQGRLAGALDVLGAQLAANPGLEELQLARGHALELAHELAEAPPEQCPCESGRPYADCCAPADRAALDRFEDRTPLVELQAAVGGYAMATPERQAGLAAAMDEWAEVGAVTESELESSPAEEPRIAMVTEWAWLAALADGSRLLLDAFAADPAVPEEQRLRAADWLGWAMWGLWEVGRPHGSPGVVVTELITGIRLYAAVPGALLEGLPRWSVLVGCMLPVDGIWRAGGSFEAASPIDARALVHELVDEVLEHGDDFGREGRPMVAWARRVHDHVGDLWLPEAVEPPSPDALAGLHATLRAALPSMVAGLRRMQGTIEWDPDVDWSWLSVEDAAAAWEALAAQPGFERDEDDDLVWYGPPDDDEDEPRVRAMLMLEEEDIGVDPDSEEDLRALLDLLEGLGHPAEIQELIDSPQPPVTLPDLPADQLAAWLRAWPDEPLPALDGASPRAALQRREAATQVETLVRYLEFEADIRGIEDFATDALRAQLGLVASG